MSDTTLSIGLRSASWSATPDTAAMGEVVDLPGSASTGTRLTFPLGVNDAPHALDLQPGDYLVRLYLPNGEVQAEQVRLQAGQAEQVDFEIARAPHEWLASAACVGVVQTLPSAAEADNLREALSSATPILASPREMFRKAPFDFSLQDRASMTELAEQALVSMERASHELNRISGVDRVQHAAGWRTLRQIDPNRAWPGERPTPQQIAEWWTGGPLADGTPLRMVESDECNGRMVIDSADGTVPTLGLGARSFVLVQDPVGARYCAVFPEGWTSISASRRNAPVTASILLTVVVNTAMSSSASAAAPARWRCAPEIDDTDAMTMLGFLHHGRIGAGAMMLERASSYLYHDSANPVAGAVGAYILLAHTDQANARMAPRWREWLHTLYAHFPMVPDGAILMAQMALAYGESAEEEDIDVEKIRGYALEAVRRGLPFLGAGVRILTDILVALEGDDRASGRQGADIDATRKALTLVHQLGRITVPGEFFTVLRLSEEGA